MSATEVLVSHTNVSIATWPTDELPLATSTGPIPLTHTRGSRDPNVRRSQVCQLYTSTMEDIAQAIGRVKADAHDRPAAIPRTALTASVRSSVYVSINSTTRRRYEPLLTSVFRQLPSERDITLRPNGRWCRIGLESCTASRVLHHCCQLQRPRLYRAGTTLRQTS